MIAYPLRARSLDGGASLFVNETGRFFAGSEAFATRFEEGALAPIDKDFLDAEGHRLAADDPLIQASHLYGLAERTPFADHLDYLILVPTLRCNLSCSYCQVSRASRAAKGFDWSEQTLEAVLGAIDRLSTDEIKIEFQGGEPTLRPDLLLAVIERCQRFRRKEFVICTNLHRLTPGMLALCDRDDVFLSTSLDGDAITHGRNRTGEETGLFLSNLQAVADRYGPGKISALPTIDPQAPPEIDALIDSYAGFGLNSIFLRPINFQGFARKRHADSREQSSRWRSYYEAFVRRLIERNWEDRSQVLEETYLSICLRRIFQPGRDRHVDLRSPNPMGIDYIVVDYDGTVYPTDEARMLSRSGVIDLSIGDIESGWEGQARDLLNRHGSNKDDPACQRCAYQPYCGRDVVDDIARYGRIDMPRLETDFCRRHLHLFDLIFSLIYADDPKTAYSLSRWLRLDGTPASLGAYLA